MDGNRLRSIGLLVALVLAGAAATVSASDDPPLTSPTELERRLGTADLRILDLRSKASFAEGHVPSAISAVYPALVRDDNWRVLDVDDLVERFSQAEVGDDSSVVVVPEGVDSTEFGGASSVHWALKYLGHESVSILDGGMYAWLRDGQPLEVGTMGAPAPADFAANLVPSIRASTDDVLAALGDGETLIIDARPPEQYRGETKSGLVARAGRIPGAMNLPHTEVFDLASRRLLAAHDILSQLPSEALRSNAPIIVYCNTGHWSSIVWFALHEVAGLPDVRLYDGSMQAWTEDPERPIETGPR